MTIYIKKSETADTRTCDVSQVTRRDLYFSSHQHISDVQSGIKFIQKLIDESAWNHDHDKVELSPEGLDAFYADFQTNFEQHEWWDNHRKVNRHHLLEEDGVPDDVNLVDVIEMIVDCVMAGMGRAGEVYPLDIDPEVLMNAFNNTAKLLEDVVVVVDE